MFWKTLHDEFSPFYAIMCIQPWLAETYIDFDS